MATLNVRLFGKFCVHKDEQILDSLHASKAQELFCYLLLHRDRPQNREALAGLLWGDNSTSQSKKYLRQALWQLQTAIDLNKNGTAGLLLVEPDWVCLNPKAELWLDVAAFEEAFVLGQKVREEEMDGQRVQCLTDAVQLYQGDLLEGWYQDWCLFERERLQNAYLLMLDKLMGYCEVHCEYEKGVMYGERILRLDRARERTHKRLMWLHYRAGNRSEALRQYHRCIATLDEELGVKPAESTVALYEQMCADRLDNANSVTSRANAHSAKDSTLPSLLECLKQFQVGLANLEHQVQQEIQVLETVLKRTRQV